MAKKLISVWLSLTILLFSTVSIYAESNIRGDYFIRNIVINGQNIENYQLDNPFFMHNNSVYFPLTEEMGKILGLSMKLDSESRTLKIFKEEPSQKDVSQKWVKNDRTDVQVQTYSNVTMTGYDGAQTKGDALGADQLLSETKTGVAAEAQPAQAGKEGTAIDLGGLPILVKGSVYYLPVSAIVNSKVFGWDAYYDGFSGVYISTTAARTAQSYFDEPASRYNRGLVNYVRSHNGSYSVTQAQELVFLFQHAADIYKIDQTLLMAVAEKESTFNPKARSSSGCIGMMQVSPSTGATGGLTVNDLYDPQKNIEFAAKHLAERIQAYGGNTTTALSAYNQGSGAVSRGSYTTRYSGNVLNKQSGINNYLQSNGYGNGN